ncbi:type I-E CRISPR-associated endoribonuclease Cas2e [Arcanobacterium canis]
MFAVLSLQAAPDHLSGYITRFLTEADVGLYVGNISQNVATNLWKRVSETIRDSHATMIISDHSQEQGFSIMTAGCTKHIVLDIDGLSLLASRPGRAAIKLQGHR